MTHRRASSANRNGGFTLLELVIVMGILSGFLVMLVQLVGLGLDLFAEGEIGQVLADRGNRAERVINDELSLLRGSAAGRDRRRADDRLLVQLLPIGLPPAAEPDATLVQVVRAAVSLPPARELPLVEGELAVRVQEENPDFSDGEIAQEVARLRKQEPLRGIGNLLLLPWRQEGADDAFLELRAAWFLPGQTVRVRDVDVDPFLVELPGSPALPAVTILQNTQPILQDLLHCEFRFWSQNTRTWQLRDGASWGQSGSAAPEVIWDSARGGLLVDAALGGEFAFDRGLASLTDPADDIHPHAIRVYCVVAMPSDLPAEGLLAGPIGPDDEGLRLVNPDRFPGGEDGGYVKVRGEWIRYNRIEGDRLTGLRRGVRWTKATAHPAGVRVHVGREVDFAIPIPHRKDDWNG